jgi:hypothetical protein
MADSDERKISRRSLNVNIVAAALSGVSAIFPAIEFTDESYRAGIAEGHAEVIAENRQYLLRKYLWPDLPEIDSGLRVPLLPAMRDLWGPRNRTFSGSGLTVTKSYVRAFKQSREYIDKAPHDLTPDDAPVLIASHLANANSERYFGCKVDDLAGHLV